jgi:hypothetical protein
VDESDLPTHFQWYQINGCANRQFGSGDGKWSRVLSAAIFLFLGIPSLVVTVALFAALPFVCVPAALADTNGPGSFFMTVSSLVVFALGTMLAVAAGVPLAIAAVALLVPAVVIYSVVACAAALVPGARARMRRARQNHLGSAASASAAAAAAAVSAPGRPDSVGDGEGDAAAAAAAAAAAGARGTHLRLAFPSSGAPAAPVSPASSPAAPDVPVAAASVEPV